MQLDLRAGTRRQLIRVLSVATLLAASISSRALTFTSDPVFTTMSNAPLAGLLDFVTDEPSRVRIAGTNATESWQREFFDYDTRHAVPLLGFKANRTNLISVTALDRFGNGVTATQAIVFVTG